MNGLFSTIKEQLQPRDLSDLLCFCRPGIAHRNWSGIDHSSGIDQSSLVSGMYILKEVCYKTTSIPAIHFFSGSIIISREYLKRSICHGHCVYFTTVVAAIHYNKRSVVDSRKFESTFIWGKPLQPCSFKGAYLLHRTSCSNFCL